MGLDQQKIIRSVRLSLTCILLFLITWYYQVPESAWSLITIWFVMFDYTTIGGVFQKSFLRFLGTVLSAVYGMLIVYLCANNPIINMLALVPGIFVYAYFFMDGGKSYVGTIGAVTLSIVLLNYNNLDLAILRILNIIIGVIAAMIMMRFFYPQFARDQLIEVQLNFIDYLCSVLKNLSEPSMPLSTIKSDFLENECHLFVKLTLVHRLVSESEIETKKAPFFTAHSISSSNHIRHLFHLMNVLITYVSTEAIHSDPWVCNQLSLLLSDLRTIEKRLRGQQDFSAPINSTSMNVDDEIKIDTKKIQNKDMLVQMMIRQKTESIIAGMSKEIILLNEDVKNIVQIYEVYEMNIEGV